MLWFRRCTISLAILLVPIAIYQPFTFAQDSTSTQIPPGPRDSGAIAVVEKSLSALGGVNVIAAVQSVESSGTILRTGSSDPITFQWKNTISGSHYEFRQETTMDGKTRVFASGHGKPGFGLVGSPAIRLSGNAVVAAIPVHLPAILLYAEFQDPTYSFTLMAPAKAGDLIHVQVANTSDPVTQQITEQDWYFDPQTFLPMSLGYNVPEARNALNTIQSICFYSDYLTQQGVQYPATIKVFRDGNQFSQVTVSSFQPNASIQSTDFDLPLEPTAIRGAN